MAKKRSSDDQPLGNRYGRILAHVFAAHYKRGIKSFEFERTEIETSAAALEIRLPKNIGDLLYSFRFRTALPAEISKTAPEGFEWVIEGAGRAKYRMSLTKITRIRPSENVTPIKIPDATPEIVTANALSDEQALLAKVRYNRLIDIFLRVTAYSLQNHLRTSVPDIGQIETDEIYVAINNCGEQYVIPVQAKGGSDQIGTTQVKQDLALCRKSYPLLTPKPVAVQFMKGDSEGETIVMFLLSEIGGEITIIGEKHYRLVPANEITVDNLQEYREKSNFENAK